MVHSQKHLAPYCWRSWSLSISQWYSHQKYPNDTAISSSQHPKTASLAEKSVTSFAGRPDVVKDGWLKGRKYPGFSAEMGFVKQNGIPPEILWVCPCDSICGLNWTVQRWWLDGSLSKMSNTHSLMAIKLGYTRYTIMGVSRPAPPKRRLFSHGMKHLKSSS